MFYKDGTATVAQWGRDASMGPTVAAVRQNLQLIVDQGQVTPGVGADNYKIWGKTLGNTVMVWRSGVGVTADGALVHAAGKGLSVASLASPAKGGSRAGHGARYQHAVDVGELLPTRPGSPQVVSAAKLLPNMARPATRFLAPDERDFVAVFIRPELLPKP